MKTADINIRDPFILCAEGKYYLYGTRSETCWGPADGFDCYISDDLKTWQGPLEIFHRDDNFFADRFFWAPECYAYDGAYYLITTFGSDKAKKGIYVLKSERPEGPYQMCSEELTPADWTSIDGTLYFQDDRIYLVFSHSFEDTPDGDMCMVELSKDLKHAVSAPVVLFSAAAAPWAKPVPFAKAEFGMDGDVYFTDGPCLIDGDDGCLYMLWSSWSNCGYAVGAAVSKSGRADGPWVHLPEPVFPENGGHGMAFRDYDGSLKYTLHFPNDKYKERPIFKTLEIDHGKIRITEG